MIMNSLELKLCDIQGRLFELFADTKYDVESLVKAFMNGELSRDLDSEYNRMQWAGEEYLLQELIESNKDKIKEKKLEFSKDVLYWIGYVYRYWHFYTHEESKCIYKQSPFKTMNDNYFFFHTLDVELAIDNFKEIYRQKESYKKS